MSMSPSGAVFYGVSFFGEYDDYSTVLSLVPEESRHLFEDLEEVEQYIGVMESLSSNTNILGSDGTVMGSCEFITEYGYDSCSEYLVISASHHTGSWGAPELMEFPSEEKMVEGKEDISRILRILGIKEEDVKIGWFLHVDYG